MHIDLVNDLLQQSVLDELINSYNAKWKPELENRLRKVELLSDADFLKSLRNNNHWRNSPTLPHIKPNRWYNKKQKDEQGKDIGQLRDALITEIQNNNVLSNPVLKTFDDYFNQLDRIFETLKHRGFKGAAQMTKYDIALYLAARKRSEPDKVFIHRGVRKGAAALGLIEDTKKDAILSLTQVLKKCPSLRKIVNAKDIENFLCIYHKELTDLK